MPLTTGLQEFEFEFTLDYTGNTSYVLVRIDGKLSAETKIENSVDGSAFGPSAYAGEDGETVDEDNNNAQLRLGTYTNTVPSGYPAIITIHDARLYSE